MLSQFYKFVVVNNSGSLLTFNNNGRMNLKITAWFVTPTTGKIDYTVLSDDDLGFEAGGSLANGAEIESTEIDNTSNLFIGIQVQLEITHDEGTAADGTFDIKLSQGDATGELETDATGYGDAEAALLYTVGSLTWEPNGLDDELMRSQVFAVE
jgi:hypothetical protein